MCQSNTTKPYYVYYCTKAEAATTRLPTGEKEHVKYQVARDLQELYKPNNRKYTGNGTFYLLTPWCRFLLEKLTSLQLVKKFPAFHGTRRFITALTSVRHLSLSWASPIQSI